VRRLKRLLLTLAGLASLAFGGAALANATSSDEPAAPATTEEVAPAPPAAPDTGLVKELQADPAEEKAAEDKPKPKDDSADTAKALDQVKSDLGVGGGSPTGGSADEGGSADDGENAGEGEHDNVESQEGDEDSGGDQGQSGHDDGGDAEHDAEGQE
jgi:hypothetical protein